MPIVIGGVGYAKVQNSPITLIQTVLLLSLGALFVMSLVIHLEIVPSKSNFLIWHDS